MLSQLTFKFQLDTLELPGHVLQVLLETGNSLGQKALTPDSNPVKVLHHVQGFVLELVRIADALECSS